MLVCPFSQYARCAMSVHLGSRGVVLEVDRSGRVIPGGDVVGDRLAEPRRPGNRG